MMNTQNGHYDFFLLLKKITNFIILNDLYISENNSGINHDIAVTFMFIFVIYMQIYKCL